MKEKKGLRDWEISIVKAMLSNGSLNKQEILSYFSRPGRSINSARIKEIEIGYYPEIEEATIDELNSFLEEYQTFTENKSQNIGTASKYHTDHPLSDTTIERILKPNDERTHLEATESESLEYKKGFTLKLASYLKTICGFMNNKGGYLVHGVKDCTFEIIGLESEKIQNFNFDSKKMNTLALDYVQQNILFDRRIYEINGNKIGVMYFYPSKDKPVIIGKENNEAKVKSGEIYYRYPGETLLIRKAELNSILQDKLRVDFKNELYEHISKILENGVGKSAILNTETGEVEGESSRFFIDTDLLEKIKITKEGELNEKEGAPTLKIIGSVKPVSSQNIVEKHITKPPTEAYPFNGNELADKIKGILPNVGRNKVWAAIKYHEIKGNKKYSTYHYRSKSHENKCIENNDMSGVQCLYNQAAVDFLAKKLAV